MIVTVSPLLVERNESIRMLFGFSSHHFHGGRRRRRQLSADEWIDSNREKDNISFTVTINDHPIGLILIQRPVTVAAIISNHPYQNHHEPHCCVSISHSDSMCLASKRPIKGISEGATPIYFSVSIPISCNIADTILSWRSQGKPSSSVGQ